MAKIREFIEMAGEFGLAYEYIGGALESFPLKISGSAAIKLLEVGLPGHNYGTAKSALADTGRAAVDAVSRTAWLMT